MKSLLARFGLMMLLAAGALPATATVSPKKLLIVTVTVGYRHASIPTAEKILADLARESGGLFTIDFIRQPPGQPKMPFPPRPGKAGENDPAFQAAMKKYQEAYQAYETVWLPIATDALKTVTPETLRSYDGVVFANTTGDLPLPDKQGFIDWVANGKAFIGLHAATDTFHGFPAFVAMIGGEFASHGPQVEVNCLNQDHAHAATRQLPASWRVFDEIYLLKNFHRERVHGLLRLDRHPNDRTPGDFPVSWCKAFEKGRVFYTSLGHREDIWDHEAMPADQPRKNSPAVAKAYQQHLLGGILWALGLAPGEAKPTPADK